MYVVINGGGKVGSFLAKTLSSKGNAVAVIEKRREVIEKLAEELPTDVLLIEGDGCDVQYQDAAGVGRADVFAAVTGDDDDNLVSCQLAKVSFNVKRTVARCNSPKNERIFNTLGIKAISSTTVIGRLVEEELSIGEIIRLYTLKSGNLAIVEVELPGEGCPVDQVRLSELKLPEETVLVVIMRGDAVIVPKGNTRLLGGDRIIALTTERNEKDLRRVLLGGKGNGGSARRSSNG